MMLPRKRKSIAPGQEDHHGGVWEKWGKVIGSLVTFCTLIGLFTGGGTYILRTIDSWARKKPVIVLRTQRLEEFSGHSKYFLKFSVVNRRDKPITLNSVVLRVGDYAYGSTVPGQLWVAFKTFSKEIRVDFAGHTEGKQFPLLSSHEGRNSMGSSEFSLIAERGSMDAHEQIDVDIVMDVSLPENFRSKYPDIWSLGGQIEMCYEDQSLKQDRVVYPERDKAFPWP